MHIHTLHEIICAVCGAYYTPDLCSAPVDKIQISIPCEHCGSDYAFIKPVSPSSAVSEIMESALAAVGHQSTKPAFQHRVHKWMMECFGMEISRDTAERNHRFLEEALELVQACGCTKQEAVQLVDYVYDRPIGKPGQEVGGVMVTLAALCAAKMLSMHAEGDKELDRVWTKIPEIRAKQASKPKFSPLPGNASYSVNHEKITRTARAIAEFEIAARQKRGAS